MNAPETPKKPALSETPKPVHEVLKESVQVPLKTDDVDQNAVAEFIRSHSGDAEEAPQTPGGAKEQPPLEFAPAGEFEQKSQHDLTMQSAFVTLDSVVVTDEEKAHFQKDVLLMDLPFQIMIPFCNGSYKVYVRSRTMYEQARIFEILEYMKKKDNKLNDLSFGLMYFYYYCAALMITKINDTVMSGIELKPGTPLEADCAKMTEFVNAKFLSLATPKWIMIMNALRIAEAKMAKLDSMAVTESFWIPRSSQG